MPQEGTAMINASLFAANCLCRTQEKKRRRIMKQAGKLNTADLSWLLAVKVANGRPWCLQFVCRGMALTSAELCRRLCVGICPWRAPMSSCMCHNVTHTREEVASLHTKCAPMCDSQPDAKGVWKQSQPATHVACWLWEVRASQSVESEDCFA